MGRLIAQLVTGIESEARRRKIKLSARIEPELRRPLEDVLAGWDALIALSLARADEARALIAHPQ